MKTLSFISFGHLTTGRLITEEGSFGFVNCRNPYGSHNLVVVDLTKEEAIAHGTEAAVREAAFCSTRTYRKVRKFLGDKRPETVRWQVSRG